METPKTVTKLRLENTCVSTNQRHWDKYMEGTTKANGALIKKHIKEHLPNLYNSLCLNFYNPYEHQSRKKKGLLVYVHSGIEYFIKYN